MLLFVLVLVSVMYAMLHMIYCSPVLFTDTNLTAVYVFGKLRLGLVSAADVYSSILYFTI